MSRILKHSIIAGLFATSASITPVSAQVARPRPPLAPTGPVKPVTASQLKQLTQAELQARSKPAPRYLTGSERKARIPASTAAGAVPDLKSTFQLTPSAQSVPSRGSMKIDRQIYLPDPSPPGFSGQAIIRRGVSGGIGVSCFTGEV